jgi:hypothetical protein
MRKRKKKLSQSDLRALGVQPGLLSTHYPAGGERAQIRRLSAAPSSGASSPFLPLASNKRSGESR